MRRIGGFVVMMENNWAVLVFSGDKVVGKWMVVNVPNQLSALTLVWEDSEFQDKVNEAEKVSIRIHQSKDWTRVLSQ